MSPKHPIRPKTPGDSNQGSTRIRDTAADNLPRRPGSTQRDAPDQPQGHPFPESSQPPDVQPPAIEIIDLPADLLISRTTTEHLISHFYLAPKMVERLPAPDPETGIRLIPSGRQYVDLVDGGTVPLGIDPQGHFKAKQMAELVPSGPRLERVEGTSKWRQAQPGSRDSGDSEPIVSRRRLPGDEQDEAGPFKRPRAIEPLPDFEPWKNWAIAPQHASPEDITIEGVRYKTVPSNDAPDHPIVYIKNPTHLVYDFDLLQRTLRRDIEQQPRGAIRIPSTHRWDIDPNLPFDTALTDYVATYFPELSEISLLNVARKQFSLANGSDTATNAGLTTLRQVFNDWKSSSTTPRPELADPLLMLPVSPMTPGMRASRTVELPLLSDQMPLQRLVFDPRKFREEWRYFSTTQYAGDLKRFMAGLLTRNGYEVFEPTIAQSYPALVFRRTGHDFVFYMTLHRVHGKKIHIPSTSDQGFTPGKSLELIGLPATRAVQGAETANKLVWLKGGSQISKDRQDSVFIVRTNDPRT